MRINPYSYRASLKNKGIMFLFLFMPFVIFSQNLVKNFSFEVLTGNCPTTIGELPIFWTSPYDTTLSSDSYNTCASSNISVPSNGVGYQFAHSGNGYAGLTTYHYTCHNCRKYLQGTLSSPLIAGQNYLVSFWLSLADMSAFSTSNIGVYFSDTILGKRTQFSTTLLPYIPQLKSDSTIWADTLNWQKLEWSYTAVGGEISFAIGNFDDDSLSHTMLVDPLSLYSLTYMLIDDVCLSSDSMDCMNVLVNTSKGEIGDGLIDIYPNPCHEKIFIEFSEIKEEQDICVNLYTTLGKNLFQSNIKIGGGNIYEIPLGQIPGGVYYLRIQKEDKNSVYKIVKQ